LLDKMISKMKLSFSAVLTATRFVDVFRYIVLITSDGVCVIVLITTDIVDAEAMTWKSRAWKGHKAKCGH